MSKLKVFFDSFSQPSRAVLLFIKANSIPYEPRMIKLADGNLLEWSPNYSVTLTCPFSSHQASTEQMKTFFALLHRSRFRQ